AVVEAAGGKPVKVILETAALDPSDYESACWAARAAGAAFVKTSTGFHSNGGATPETVSALRQHAAASMGVKASGGIRRLHDGLTMLTSGANRLGSSAAASWGAALSRPLRDLLR